MDEVRLIAEDLIGGPVKSVNLAVGGGNNRVFQLDHGGRYFALKFYPHQEDDPRDRLGTEWRALAFMTGAGIETVPRPLARDVERYCALYEWIEGAHVEEAAESDVIAMADFLEELQSLGERDGALEIGPASAACFSVDETVDQLRSRLERVQEVAVDFPELEMFLSNDLAPAVRGIVDLAWSRLAESGVSETRGCRVLSPSDFGLHNTLKRPDGRLVFLDFEYFGWDSLEKTTADVMLHPGMEVPENLGRLFFERVKRRLATDDQAFEGRFRALYPLYALIWCLIMLNEFIPERWERRNLGHRRNDRVAVHARQLALARKRLGDLKKNYETF